ncbi:MAG: RNA polymerase sigma factor [Acidobacteriaceae bacterium]
MIGEATLDSRVAVQATAMRDTFLDLIAQYEPALRRLAGAYLDQPSDRDDLFQEIAVALWQALPKYRGESSQRTWLYRVAHNVAISYVVRFRRRRRSEEEMPENFEFPSAHAGAEDSLLQAEKARLLNTSIRGLGTVDRQIVVLHLEGLSYAEIEEVAGRSQTAIATRLTRAREKLKQNIRAAGRNSDERSR